MYTWTKNNPEKRDKPKGLACVSGCQGKVMTGADGKWVAPTVLCPVCIGWHAKVLQARDAGVTVEALKAPVFSKIAQLEKVPSGATVVVDKEMCDAVAGKVGRLVLVITREQEQQGLMYDGSQPFVRNGLNVRPPCRGVWFVPSGTGYAVFAWASAGGVTHRLRKLMRTVNVRAGKEEIPTAIIERLSSRSLRIAMATLLSQRGVPIEEVVENGEWEDVDMCRTYIRSLEPLAVQRRNLSDVIFPAGAGGGAGSLVATAAPHTLGSIQEPPWQSEAAAPRSVLEIVAAVMEQEDGLVPLVPATTDSPKSKKRRPESMPCCPALWVRGKVFKRESIAGDVQLRALLHETASEKPSKVQKLLCAGSYHVTRKEITNHRERMALQAMEAPAVQEQEMLLAIAE